MKRKDIIVGMEIGICDNLRPDSTGNRHWSKGIVTAVQKLHDGTYEVLYETLKGKPRGTNLSRVKPWADASVENAASRAAVVAAVQQRNEEEHAWVARCGAFREVAARYPATVKTLVSLQLDSYGRAVLTITDPKQFECILAALSKETE